MPDLTDIAWEHLQRARMEFEGRGVCVCAADDDTRPSLNYRQCFVRDFAVCAPAFLLRGEHEVVAEFLTTAADLQMKRHPVQAFQPRRGLMPASFRPVERDGRTVIDGDYGEESIARVTPVDSLFWWLLTLRAYTKATGDRSLAAREEIQQTIVLILELTLEGSFELFPTILVPDGSFMIDRRMGVYGHPLEVQALFFAGLRSVLELLEDDAWREPVERRLRNLTYHVERFYWLDRKRLAELQAGGPDQYGDDVPNVFNVFPGSIPDWVEAWIPEDDDAGYFVGNVGPGRIDFRFFTQGNLLTASSGLADPDQRERLMRLIECRWDELVGAAPLRIIHPALEGEEWRLLTGADEKNRPWCYHNGGSWPALLWSFANATVSSGRPDLLERALEATEARLDGDAWVEYYDGHTDPRPGARARRLQSWSMGAYLYARACLDDPSAVRLYCWMDRMDEVEPEEAGVER